MQDVSVSAGVDRSYTLIPGTGDVSSRAATIRGHAATALVATWNLTSDTLTKDTVDLSSDLSDTAPSTPTSRLTTSLAQLLKGASHVDAATGAREINTGISDTLARQVGQLLTDSGFSETDTASASASLVQQFASASSGTNVVALSLARQNDDSGAYSAAVGGGQEVSAYTVKSTSALNITFDLDSGKLSVKLDQHKIAATRIEWSSRTATDVSIDLKQPELEALGFAAPGTHRNAAGTPVEEGVTSTVQAEEGIGSGNTPGANSLSSYLAFEATASTSRAGLPATPSNPASAKQASAEAALAALTKIAAQARSAASVPGQAAHGPANLIVTQQVGAVVNKDGNKFLLYNRPGGDAVVVDVPGISVEA